MLFVVSDKALPERGKLMGAGKKQHSLWELRLRLKKKRENHDYWSLRSLYKEISFTLSFSSLKNKKKEEDKNLNTKMY